MKSIISPEMNARDEARREIRRQLQERHKEEIARSGFWRELLIRFKIEREVAEEMKRRFPPHALYTSVSRQ